MADDDRTFSPTQAQASRTRMQARPEPPPLDLDDDDDEAADLEARSFADDDAGSATGASLDPRAIGEPDNPELDWGEPLGDDGLVHGANHTRRAVSTEADRGHGPKTRARSKEIINRKA